MFRRALERGAIAFGCINLSDIPTDLSTGFVLLSCAANNGLSIRPGFWYAASEIAPRVDAHKLREEPPWTNRPLRHSLITRPQASV